jgi:N-formylglutamate amidohydrolase
MITANYSRWVIDLNRDPENKPLYADGRIITGLCPVTNFWESLYADGRTSKNIEVNRRRERYYRPYHEKLADLLSTLKSEFGKILLWDCPPYGNMSKRFISINFLI